MIPPAFAGHAALLQEPWGFTPDEVKRLSARQVQALYLTPAVERAERLKAKDQGGVYVKDDRPATWEQFAAAIGPHTAPGADLKAMYDKYVKGFQKKG